MGGGHAVLIERKNEQDELAGPACRVDRELLRSIQLPATSAGLNHPAVYLTVTGLIVDRTSIGWTMILKDDSGVTAWKWRVGNYLLLSVSLIAMQVRSDLEFPKHRHYTWKTGKSSVFIILVIWRYPSLR
ncbi:hypothetical protein E1301_Tti018184 [Triplophysa tibetana]|uniref:Uncharacterized protein n=1 Tax=Triplophysa tibetana TaxID=1572043 RepID=A0A5A9P273_9TELE|nr:hypothetical protein E1301_Tti018184 [Triplophysa tibetana]